MTPLNELFAALAKAQGEMGFARKTSYNPFFKSYFADIGELVKASRPALTKYGLSVTQCVKLDEEGSYLETILGHSSGQYLSSNVRISPAKTDIQALGSYLSYLKRYTYGAIVGVFIEGEDDDGEEVMTEVRRQPLAALPAPVPVQYITDDQIDQLNEELKDHLDIKDTMFQKMGIKSLNMVTKPAFLGALRRIREMKAIKAGNI